MGASYSSVFVGDHISRSDPPACCGQRMQLLGSPSGPRYVCLTCENIIKVSRQGVVINKP